ncbi:MAG: IS4 family transposase [Chloroflexi bacterium]|nr:IS4 family transposase [Chloroflexota bacterium]
MRQLLPAQVLTTLARCHNADDVRHRKLTCIVFFWMTLLAFGPGGPITLHKILTYALVASLMGGLGAAQVALSKEAVSENFRERPWPFFAAVLQYLLTSHAQLWSQLAGQPNWVVLQDLRVLLIDATVMRVAQQLIGVFPASRNGKCQAWAAVKLHTALPLFRGVPEVLDLTAQKKNERKIDFLRPVGEAVLYIFDLGYWTYDLFDTMMDRQQHFISRLRQDCNPLIVAVYVGNPQWVGQRLKAIDLTGRTVDLLVNLSSANPSNPQMRHAVRLVGQWIAKDRRWHLYITSLVAWQQYPLTLLIDLYRLRWQIEILFRNLKHVLRMANFVSITENGIRIQIYAALLHYMLTHLIILKAAHETGRRVEDFSVPYCLDAVQQVLQQTGDLVLKGQTPDWDVLEQRLVQTVIMLGLRPNRKRKPLITKVKARLRRTVPLPVR